MDISLSALLADNVFNFGELLLHPIVSCLTCPIHRRNPLSVLGMLTILDRLLVFFVPLVVLNMEYDKTFNLILNVSAPICRSINPNAMI